MRGLVVLVVAGCASPAVVSPVSSSAPEPDCAAVAAHTAEVLAPEVTSTKNVALAVDVHCRREGWSAAARACIVGAADHAAAHVCAHDELTGKQYDLVVADLVKQMRATAASKLLDECEAQLGVGRFSEALTTCNAARGEHPTDAERRRGEALEDRIKRAAAAMPIP